MHRTRACVQAQARTCVELLPLRVREHARDVVQFVVSLEVFQTHSYIGLKALRRQTREQLLEACTHTHTGRSTQPLHTA